LDPRPAAFTLPFHPAATPKAAAAVVPVLFCPESGGLWWWSVSLELKITEKKEQYIDEEVDLARKIHLPRALNFFACVRRTGSSRSSIRHTRRL
jgi:hypothetical protein